MALILASSLWYSGRQSIKRHQRNRLRQVSQSVTQCYDSHLLSGWQRDRDAGARGQVQEL
jgi:hypothetical protein